jgi:hypothetical protein
MRRAKVSRMIAQSPELSGYLAAKLHGKYKGFSHQ